jgi:hypothetical protein
MPSKGIKAIVHSFLSCFIGFRTIEVSEVSEMSKICMYETPKATIPSRMVNLKDPRHAGIMYIVSWALSHLKVEGCKVARPVCLTDWMSE